MTRRTGRAVFRGPARWKRLASEPGQHPVAADAESFFHEPAEAWLPEHRIDQRGSPAAGEAAHQSNVREQPGPEGHRAVPVVVSQELGLQPGHIHGRGALGLARLALHAQVHDLEQTGIGECLRGQLPGQHGAQCIGPTPGAVLLVPGGLKAGTHGSLVALAADPGAVAHLHGAEETPVIGKVSPVLDRQQGLAGMGPQMFGHGRGVHHDVRVEEPLRIKRGLHPAKQLVEIGPEETLVE